MPETDTIPVSASVASTGKGIRYIGNHAYAYSGIVAVDTNLTTLLDFSVDNNYIISKFQPFYDDADQGDNVLFEIK